MCWMLEKRLEKSHILATKFWSKSKWFDKKCLFYYFQVDLFMLELFNAITEEEAGVLKAKLSEQEYNELRKNPFHITDSNIKVS